jgi:hypothetical protein
VAVSGLQEFADLMGWWAVPTLQIRMDWWALPTLLFFHGLVLNHFSRRQVKI